MSGLLIFWIGVMIGAIVLEASTMGLTSIWFAGGALIAMLIELLHGGLYLQIIVFLIVSLVLLFYTRPVAVKYFNKEREKTNVNSVIGKSAVVTAKIHNMQETGQVVVDGKEWTARSKDPAVTFEKDEIVKVVSISGVKLMVEAL